MNFPHITLPSKHSISILCHSISDRWKQLRTSATLTNRWRAHSACSPKSPLPTHPRGQKADIEGSERKGKSENLFVFPPTRLSILLLSNFPRFLLYQITAVIPLILSKKAPERHRRIFETLNPPMATNVVPASNELLEFRWFFCVFSIKLRS